MRCKGLITLLESNETSITGGSSLISLCSDYGGNHIKHD